MRHAMRWRGGATLALLVLAATTPASAATETLVAGQRVRMPINVPVGYSYKAERNESGLTEVELENPVWRITLRVYISGDFPTKEALTETWQRDLVVRFSSGFLSESKQGDYQWQSLRPSEGSGVYCVFSDAAARKVSDLPPDGYLHVVTGAKVIKGAAMYFQIWCNDLTTPEYREIFDLMLHGFDRS